MIRCTLDRLARIAPALVALLALVGCDAQGDEYTTSQAQLEGSIMVDEANPVGEVIVEVEITGTATWGAGSEAMLQMPEAQFMPYIEGALYLAAESMAHETSPEGGQLPTVQPPVTVQLVPFNVDFIFPSDDDDELTASPMATEIDPLAPCGAGKDTCTAQYIVRIEGNPSAMSAPIQVDWFIDGEVFAPPTQGDDDESPTITLRVVNAD